MKPKCFGCNKKGDELIYYWYSGNLWHYSCLIKVSEQILKAIDKK